MEDTRLLGKNLKYLREKRGMTQEDIAEMFSCSRDCISKWENTGREPHSETLMQIADYFQVDLDSMLRSNIEQWQNDISMRIVASGFYDTDGIIIETEPAKNTFCKYIYKSYLKEFINNDEPRSAYICLKGYLKNCFDGCSTEDVRYVEDILYKIIDMAIEYGGDNEVLDHFISPTQIYQLYSEPWNFSFELLECIV